MDKVKAFYLLQAIRNGTVPQAGTQYIATGIHGYLEELTDLLEAVKPRHSLFKWVIGEYGSGKTFLATAFKEVAFDRKAVVATVTISQETPLHKFEDFYKSIMQHLHLPESPLVGGLPILLETWLLQLENKVKSTAKKNKSSSEIIESLNESVKESLAQLGQTESGFTRALQAYYEARNMKDYEAINAVIGWLKGEKVPYMLKERIGLVGEVNRQTAFAHLQVLLYLIQSVGYHSLVIIIDEVESLLRLRTQNLRQSAYDNIRYILDECAQDHFPNCFFLFSGTPALFDDEHGFQGFRALLDRLQNTRVRSYENYRLPVMHIDPWDEEKALLVSQKLLELHQQVYSWELPDSEKTLQTYIQHCIKTSDCQHIFPRIFLKCLVDHLDKKQQYPDYDLSSPPK